MVDSLLTALQGLRYDPFATYSGMAAKGIGEVSGPLVESVDGTGQKIGVTLGSMLLSSLLGRMAVNDANKRTLENQKIALSLDPLTPEQRIATLEDIEDPLSRRSLINYNATLRAQELGLASQIEAKRKEIEAITGAQQLAEADFFATPKGQAAFEAELSRAERLADARRIARDPVQTAREMSEFYDTPQGQRYIEQQREISQAKRKTEEEKTFESELRREEEQNKQKNRLELVDVKNQNEINRKSIFAQLDTDQKVQLEKRLSEQRNADIQAGVDPETNSKKILAEVDAKLDQEGYRLRTEQSEKRIILVKDLELRNQTQLEELRRRYPKIPVQLTNRAAVAAGMGEEGLQLAADIRELGGRAQLLAVKNSLGASIFKEYDVASRLDFFTQQYRLAVTGTAAQQKELETIMAMIKGSAAATPEEVATRIENLVRTTRESTANALAAASNPAEEIVRKTRENPLYREGFTPQRLTSGASLTNALGTPSVTPTVSPTVTPAQMSDEQMLAEISAVKKRIAEKAKR